LVIDRERPLEPSELAAYRELHRRRRRGEPVAYLRGHREFYSRSFRVDRRVLVPRPETELLVETALRRTRAIDLCARGIDLCTGSGCVAITIKKERPESHMMASDISRDALEVARLNAERLGALVGLIESDLFDKVRGRFDLVTCNPPYIPEGEMDDLPVDVRDFEPRLALAAGADGLTVTRRLVADAPSVLAPRGLLVVESLAGTAPQVAALMQERGFAEIEIDRDYAGHERIVSGRWPS
jgi:release factor glutamine methyltransferase